MGAQLKSNWSTAKKSGYVRLRIVIHKAVAGRPQDVRDIEGIVYRQRDRLDIITIRRWLQMFADLLDNSDVRDHFERPWRRINTKSASGLKSAAT